MLRIVAIGLYTALALCANPALAGADAAALATGEMKKLVFAEAPKPLPEIAIVDGGDAERQLAEWKGKWVVLNFWATWCAPCRIEMPSLDRLQAAMPEVAVLPVATGRNSVEAINRFYGDAGVTNLPILRDPKSALSRELGVLGLPVTLILNPEGEEVARLIGDAVWDSDDAKAVLTALAAGQ
ncbi:TlpA family protein disulfide reductase [Tabrizicola sp. J26]|uniref:TlpA family protein disulfide reductase n=1 Tax=Alitabrizicola rongguiensis TaxID=2909234 RepID=UPI001F36608E|nr:TlpA disulfide reductase family protein [Tabrizicola rongguiensis]MCF1708086.1 TlpA family protein disulfide reductase [Tabrizicola rongguiensis]